MDIKKLLGQKIRHYRKAKGYTLTQFAQILHKSKSSISKYENGEVSVDIETLYDVAKSLDVPLRLLFEDSGTQELPQIFRPVGAPAVQKNLLYIYIWDGRSKKPLRKNVFIMGEDTAALYVDVNSYTEYTKCNYHYFGEMQKFDASVRTFLVNPANERDLVLINFADPLNYQSTFYGFFSSFSIGQFQPFSTKCVISSSIIWDEEKLKNMLMMAKDDLKSFKRLNMFRVTSPNFIE